MLAWGWEGGLGIVIEDPRVLKFWLYQLPEGIRVLKQDTSTIGVTPAASLRPLCFGNDGVQDM